MNYESQDKSYLSKSPRVNKTACISNENKSNLGLAGKMTTSPCRLSLDVSCPK